ncbi:MAG TPA: tetratricopeptide repeat protein [Candidatus Angelobacter sp.]|nr:tetratricopeptide repeat protein [Candidatus Angelobacter sp.]
MRAPRTFFGLSAFILIASIFGVAQTTESNDPERDRALRVYHEHKMPEAVPLLEKVIARLPNDAAVHEALGSALISRAETQTDPEKRKADRLYARKELLRAKELGDTSDLCRVLLAGIPEDGSDIPYSENKEVEAVMSRGEAAFARGDFDHAIQEYSRALEMDPKLYLAAVYVGDMYFRQKKMDQAGEWFARAIQVDRDQEVAYRYWGDALLMQGKNREARAKYIEGLVADPYRQTSWGGMNNWVHQNHVNYKNVKVQLPKAPAVDAKGQINITVDASNVNKDDGSVAWLAYSMERALWQKEKFSKEFPQEKTYRHSLKEEAAALTRTATVFQELKQKDKSKPDPSLMFLSQLKTDSMIEPYVLLVLPDAGISQDYPAYRAANRDKLITFVDKYILPAMPQ